MPCHAKSSERAYQCKRTGWFPQEGEEIHDTVSFEEVWNNFCLTQFFKNTIESMEEIKSLFDEARSALLKVKKLKKLEDPRKLGLATEAAKITMTFASFSTKSPYGIVNNLEVGVENCIIHVYFQEDISEKNNVKEAMISASHKSRGICSTKGSSVILT
ncbi:hypothetical protein F2Q69_00052786 [Brassica cretica]|uniref:Uncharacterized protein n=1 Tax=Brassica cretica TaxID=69181 RepID=A0A8S9MYL1_BRACR|nr:hypothetical protein F2Q69_00052786 [Brassica cretica]